MFRRVQFAVAAATTAALLTSCAPRNPPAGARAGSIALKTAAVPQSGGGGGSSGGGGGGGSSGGGGSGGSSGGGSTGGGTTVDSPIPGEWKDIATLAGDVASIFGPVKAAYGFIKDALTVTGFLGKPDDPVQDQLTAIRTQLNAIYAAVMAGDFQQRWLAIDEQVGSARAARTRIQEWAQANSAGTTPLDPNTPEGASIDQDTSKAMAVLLTDAFWHRPADANTYSDYFWNVISDRAPIDGSGQVWDYRVVLPALYDVATLRMTALGAMHPTFARDAYYANELQGLKKQLLAAYNTMQSGIRCGYSYQFVPDPVGGTVDQWEYYAGCGDIYSGATSYRSLYWWDNDEPDTDGTWAKGAAPADMQNARADLQDQMGLHELAAFIDLVSSMTVAWAPLYVDASQQTLADVSGVLSLAPGSSDDGDLWTWDPDLGRLRNGLGLCMQVQPNSVIMTSATISGSSSAIPNLQYCDWTQSNMKLAFTTSEPIHLVDQSNDCFQFGLGTWSQGAFTACSTASIQRVSFTPPPYNGPLITQVLPAFGPPGGGTSIDILGTGFDQSMTVKFGANQGLYMLCPNSTWCNITSPPSTGGGVGPVSVTAILGAQTSPSSPNAVFTYQNPPVATGVLSVATGSVTLNGVAPAGGAVVTLASSDPLAVNVPASVTVPAGASAATFAISYPPATVNETVTLTASYLGTSATTSVSISASPAYSLTDDNDSFFVVYGQTVTFTVQRNTPAPPGGVQATLSSSLPQYLPVPASVTIPAGAYSASFTSTSTYASTVSKKVTITATMGAVQATATVDLRKTMPPILGGGG